MKPACDDDEGANLADMWIDNRSTTWSHEEVMNFCGIRSIMACRYGRTGLMRGSNNRARHNVSLKHGGTQIINSLWHGIPSLPTLTGFGCRQDIVKAG